MTRFSMISLQQPINSEKISINNIEQTELYYVNKMCLLFNGIDSQTLKRMKQHQQLTKYGIFYTDNMQYIMIEQTFLESFIIILVLHSIINYSCNPQTYVCSYIYPKESTRDSIFNCDAKIEYEICFQSKYKQSNHIILYVPNANIGIYGLLILKLQVIELLAGELT